MADVYLPADSQTRLLQIARQTLTEFVCGKARSVAMPEDPYLKEVTYGAFVTLYKHDELRGCVGNCTPNRSLYETLIDVTEAAASRDSRVAPIAKSELDEIRLNITVISPLVKIAHPFALEIGKHGLFIAQGGRRGGESQ